MQVIFKPADMINRLSVFEKKDLPSMSVIALNRALFNTRKDLQNSAKDIFDRPVPYTLNGFLYKKAKFGQPEALLFINESRSKGTSPAEYLLPQIIGSKHKGTRFQGAMLNTYAANAYGRLSKVGQRGKMLLPAIPTRARPGLSENKVRVNKYGNMSPGQFVQIKQALQGGVSSADTQDLGGLIKPQDAGPNTKYIYLDKDSLSHGYFANRGMRNAKPGVYFIRHLKKGKRYHRVMTQQETPFRPKKFDFQEIAKIHVEKNFLTEMSKILHQKGYR
jgi:hypothetical protein